MGMKQGGESSKLLKVLSRKNREGRDLLRRKNGKKESKPVWNPLYSRKDV